MSDEPPILSGRKTVTEALKEARKALHEIGEMTAISKGILVKDDPKLRAYLRTIHELASAAHARSMLYPSEKEDEVNDVKEIIYKIFGTIPSSKEAAKFIEEFNKPRKKNP